MDIIRVEGLAKGFKLYKKPSDRLKEIFFRRPFHHRYEALQDISFTVKQGEILGILGRNGAGKSTLLKVLMGVLLPDHGDIDIKGRVTGLLELGTGFDPNLTGLQNIFSNGLLIGMTQEDIQYHLQDIIDFSELGEFIHEPLRTYSSGMTMRLAFSIAIHANPKCFLVDEALSVGDGHFQQKCMRRIKAFREQGGAIIFVSHDLNAVKMLCERAIVLDEGRVACAGSPEDAVNYYNRIMAEMDEHEGDQAPDTPHSYGDLTAEILQGELVGAKSGSDVVAAGEETEIRLDILAHDDVRDVSVGVLLRDRFGQDIFGTNSFHLGKQIALEKGQKAQVCFRLPMNIAPGKYTVTVALHTEENHLDDCYHWCDNLIRFEVAGVIGEGFSGVCRLPSELDVKLA